MELNGEEAEAVHRYLRHLQITGNVFSREGGPAHNTISIAVIGDNLVGHLWVINRLVGIPTPGPDNYDPFQEETIDLIRDFQGHRIIIQFVNPEVMPSWTEDGWTGSETNLAALRYALRSEATFFVYLPTRGKTFESLRLAWQAWIKLLAGEMSEQRDRSRTLFVVAHEIGEENEEHVDLSKQGQAFGQELGAFFMRMRMDDFEAGKADLTAIIGRILYQRAVDHGFAEVPTESVERTEAKQTRAQKLCSRLKKVFLNR